jgi:YVTN family beta-propeller protein
MVNIRKRATIVVITALATFTTSPVSDAAATDRLTAEYGTVWVTNRTLHNLTAFDAGTGEVVGTVAVGNSPIGVVAPLVTGKVYTSDEGSNQVSVMSRATRARVAVIPVGLRPHHMMASPRGDRIYVAEFGSNTVGVIDTASDRKIATFAASPETRARTHAVWPSPDGRRVYATNEVTNDIAAIDARTGRLLWNLPVGERPSEILVMPDGRTAYVTVRNEDKVKEVDLAVPRLTGREATVGRQPDTMQLTPDQRTIVVALRGTPAEVSFVRLRTPALEVTRVRVPGTTTGHHWLSRSGLYTFVATEGEGAAAGLAVIDNRTVRAVDHYPYPGGGRPHGVFYDLLLPSYRI